MKATLHLMIATYTLFAVPTFTGCYVNLSPAALQAGPDGLKVRELLKLEKEQPEFGPLEGGSAVYFSSRDAAFWVKDDTVYTVNERARKLAPDLKPAPDSVTYAAVYDASLPFPSFTTSRAEDIASEGKKLSEEEAKALEDELQVHPDDLWARTKLIGYYWNPKRRSDATEEAHARHVLWVVKNMPEAPIVSVPEGGLRPSFIGKGPFSEAQQIWKAQIDKNPTNVRILGNAAAFFLIHDKKLAGECLDKCIALEPNNPTWRQRKAWLLSLDIMAANMFGTPLKVDAEAAKQAVQAKEKELEVTTLPGARISALADLATLAFEADDYEKAKKSASDALLGAKFVDEWNRGNIVHSANTVLGRLALKEGDVAKAKEYLIASASISSSPQLNSFGSTMQLAKELLEKGERDAVIQYLELCSKFRENDQIKGWIETLKKGGTPNFAFRFAPSASVTPADQSTAPPDQANGQETGRK